MNHCVRSNGSERACFETPEDAAAYRDQHPAYLGDVVVFCGRCGLFHCPNPNWGVERPWEIPVEGLKVN
jgi:hypothetical protein